MGKRNKAALDELLNRPKAPPFWSAPPLTEIFRLRHIGGALDLQHPRVRSIEVRKPFQSIAFLECTAAHCNFSFPIQRRRFRSMSSPSYLEYLSSGKCNPKRRRCFSSLSW